MFLPGDRSVVFVVSVRAACALPGPLSDDNAQPPPPVMLHGVLCICSFIYVHLADGFRSCTTKHAVALGGHRSALDKGPPIHTI